MPPHSTPVYGESAPPHSIRIAIIEPNLLAGLGLQQLLRDIIPGAEVNIYISFDEMAADGSEQFVHFFVSSRIYFEHALFFRRFRQRSIVMVSGDMTICGVPTLNVCQSQGMLVKDLVGLRRMGHPGDAGIPQKQPGIVLSPREVEVARLLAKGRINKEIAEELSISTTTVISHRKNIMEKLHARSLADVVVYAVVHGFVDVGE